MSLDQDSLFSLEVVVDKLSLPKVACRFPSVAFRLLDFPTLIINHVEPDLGDKIKRKIQMDPHYKLPLQLNELKDKDDQFPISKGKTCLLKISPNALNIHLTSTPLYVMVVDTYPETPKLIGNCTIPMDEVMDKLYDDICEHGVSVPSTQGEKGIHNIYNLMGKHVGKIILGFRLLSLGRSLISHMPDHAVTRSKAQTTATRAVDTQIARQRHEPIPEEEQQQQPLVVHDLEAADKHTQVAIYPEKPQLENALSQTNQDVLQTIATQTSAKKTRKGAKKLEIKFEDDPVNDLVVTNTECPPPLFFNSNCPEYSSAMNLNELADISKQKLAKKLYANGMYASPDSEDDCSDDSSIRQEDKYSDDDDGQAFLTSTKKVRVKNISKPPTTAVKKTTIAQQQAGLLGGLQDIAAMPLLNALMSEILSLKGISQQPAPGGRGVSPPRARPPAAKVQHEDFLVRNATPRQKQAPQQRERKSSVTSAATRRSFHECSMEGKPLAVPKNKSWLRSDPAPVQVGVTKTKLFSGMTNTQRLRLAKTNPSLLRQLEQKEDVRLSKLSRPRRPYSARGRQGSDHGNAAGEEEVATGRGHRPPPLDFGDLQRENSESHSHHKRPVPTPRHSISMRHSGALVQVPPITPRASVGKKFFDDYSDEEPVRDVDTDARRGRHHHQQRYDDSDRSESHKSIEVHVPSVSQDGYDDDDVKSNATSDGAPAMHQGRNARGHGFGRTRVLNSPGFPRSSVDSRSSAPMYSEDFEPSSYGEEPELRRVVDKYSDDDDDDDFSDDVDENQAPRPIVGEMPEGLRMMVDRYSDDGDASQKSEDISFTSAKSHESIESRQSKLAINNSILNPTSSMRSPSPVPPSHRSTIPTREPVAASSSASQETPGGNFRQSAFSPESTISEVSGGAGGQRGRRDSRHSYSKRPRPSPRQNSIRTDSVSSYAPSDGEDASPLTPGAYMSDVIDDVSEVDAEYAEIRQKLQQAKDARVSAEAKFGYTWTPGQ